MGVFNIHLSSDRRKNKLNIFAVTISYLWLCCLYLLLCVLGYTYSTYSKFSKFAETRKKILYGRGGEGGVINFDLLHWNISFHERRVLWSKSLSRYLYE